ncbi:flagellar assembly protein FliW [Brevibacillus borstelensis]|jgi:flagellar assembly factor FliW|uniref:flagellar assembly protein FliW n=1 Tax=Brevibacillus borstelensis TaxID=45462 RepID=UPI002E1C23AF|nr:flagellar assembly protein FliW [Brevibacillus borstelensis]MED1873016.1 flagellar assembly protein FliW [Brevibacillus borstelensis]
MAASTELIEMKVYFEEGIPGFLDLRFFQIKQQEKDSPFFLLVSLENPSIEFGLINPFSFFSNYEFQVDQQMKGQLGINDDTAIIVLNIVTIQGGGEVTVNMKAPVIINLDNQKAKQVILNDDRYPIRQPLFSIERKVASE